MTEPHSALLSAWARFADDPGAPFTVPGHKHRAGAIWPELGRVLRDDVPMFGGVSPVPSAERDLAAAESATAQRLGADWCRYSTGGSTQANQILALAVGRPGDAVLVARTAHRSTLSGLVLAGLQPVWMPTDIDRNLGLPTGLSVSAVREALRHRPDVIAMLLVEPSYVGTVSDVRAIVEIAHEQGLLVIVDQAWGAHFGHHPSYPPHALGVGADAMVLSAHKTLPAYSQGSLIAARTDRLSRERLDRAADALLTTSPAGSVLASVDAAMALLATRLGHELLGRLVDITATARDRIRNDPALTGAVVPGPEDFPPGRFDPAKLVIQLAGTGRSGVDLGAALAAAGVPVEQAERDLLLPIVTLADDRATMDRFCTALSEAAQQVPKHEKRTPVPSAAWTAPIPAARLSPREAFFSPSHSVPAAEAVGQTAAELIAPYPAGVPVLVPGEVITWATVEALHAAREAGARIAYAADPTLATLKVVAAPHDLGRNTPDS